MKNSLNRTQMAGLILVGLSLITFIGGGILVSSWLAAVEPSGVNIYVKDAGTNQHLPKDIVTVSLTGFSYFGVDYPLNVVLKASKTTITYWSFSSSLATMYYVSVTATGYVTQTGKVSMPVNFIAEYTYKLNPSVYEDLYDKAGEKQTLREMVEAQQREIEALKTRLGEAQVGNPNTI